MGATTTHFALDGAGGLPEVISTTNGTAYLHLPGVIVAQNAAGERVYLLSDGLGSVRQVISGTTVVEQRDFDPYGNPTPNAPRTTPYAFTGEWWENDLKLLHLRARWYAPETGTFLSRDPWESEPPYQYVRGNVVNLVDPGGHIGIPWEEIIEWLEERANDLKDKTNSALQISRDLARVDWLGAFDTEGLEGDWHSLTPVWFFETSPSSLGFWGIDDNGIPVVTITSGGYIEDLRARANYAETVKKFRDKYPDFSRVRLGDNVTNNFNFTGAGTTTGEYQALEWFLGSYNTTITAYDIDATNCIVHTGVVVSNTSHWQSGVRLPPSWIEMGLPPYLISNVPRDNYEIGPYGVGPYDFDPIHLDRIEFGTKFGFGGTFKQRFVWEDTIQY